MRWSLGKKIVGSLLLCAALLYAPSGKLVQASPALAQVVTPAFVQIQVHEQVLLPSGRWSAPRPQADGSGGAFSWGPGCRKVTITNEVRSSVFKTTLIKLYIWTNYCYSGAYGNGKVTKVSTGYYTGSYAVTTNWMGIQNTETWHTGENSSQSYHHMKQGMFCTSAGPWGCTAYFYPWNRLDVKYDGTYTWATANGG